MFNLGNHDFFIWITGGVYIINMTNPQTLDDLVEERAKLMRIEGLRIFPGSEVPILPSRLREAAIKWIKSADLSLEHTESVLRNWMRFNKHSDIIKSIHCVIEFIKFFFNITEEDLK